MGSQTRKIRRNQPEPKLVAAGVLVADDEGEDVPEEDPRRRAFVKQIHKEAIERGLSGDRLAKAIEEAWKAEIPE